MENFQKIPNFIKSGVVSLKPGLATCFRRDFSLSHVGQSVARACLDSPSTGKANKKIPVFRVT